MKRFFRHTFIGVALSLGLGAMAVAQELKVGFVNTDKIMQQADSAKEAQDTLQKEFAPREREVNRMGETLKAAAEKFDRDAPTLSEAQRVSRQKQLAEQDRDFQRKRREFQEDLNARRSEELQKVLERANRVLKQVAETEKYDFVLQDAVYINPKHDITDKVIKVLNASSSR